MPARAASRQLPTSKRPIRLRSDRDRRWALRTFDSEATETLARVSEELARWLEAWQAASAVGFQGADDAILGTDNLLQHLEGAKARWSNLEPPQKHAGTYAQAAGAFDDLIHCVMDLMAAVDGRDLERIRVLSQAVESAGKRLPKLAER